MWSNTGVLGYQFGDFTWMEGDPPIDYATHRAYGYDLGRWLTPDPLGGDITNPQSLNRYAYALNNPTTLTDPLGLDSCTNTVNSDGSITTNCTVSGSTGPGLGGGIGECPFFGCIPNCSIFACPPASGFPTGGGGGGEPTPAPAPKPASTTPKNVNPCASLGSTGGVVPLDTSNGQLRFQFNLQGALTGLGLQLTGPVPLTTSGFSIPANTFVGASLTSANSITIGFTNPVQTLSSFGVSAYIQSATFSGSSFSNVNGAAAFLSIPLGRTTTPSSILAWFLNRNSAAKNTAAGLLSTFETLNKNVGCSTIFGGAQ